MTMDPTPTPTQPVTPVQPVSPAQPQPQPSSPVVVTPASRRRGALDYLLGAALVLAIGGVAFAVGRGTAPAATQVPLGGLVPGGNVTVTPNGSFDPGGFAGGPGAVDLGGPTIEGTVAAIDADSITLTLADGSELEVALEADTTYHEATSTDASTIAVGDEVSVRGQGGRPTVIGQGDGGGTASGDPGVSGLTADDVTVRR